MGTKILLSNDKKRKEQLLVVLNRMQNRSIDITSWLGFPGRIMLVCEDWDWLAVLQWLQDNGLMKQNPMRPPLKAFEEWLRDNNVPQRKAHYSAYEMSLAHRHINGARYPWNEVQCDPGMIRRWRILYNDLTRLFNEESAR